MPFDAGAVVGAVRLDTSDYQKNAAGVVKHNESMFASVFKANVAYDALKTALRATVNVVKSSITAWTQQEDALKQTETVLKSTGYAAGLTLKEVADLSGKMQDLTGIGDEVVLSAENVLLRFTKIGKEVFPQALESVLNVSTAMGQDLRSSAMMLGRALEDPVRGMTQMRRMGIIFTDSQQDVVKQLLSTGKTAEAQAVILKELEKQFGGTAKAARETFSGSMKNLQNQIGDTQEVIGQYITTVGQPFVETTADMTKSVKTFLESREGMNAFNAVLAPLAGTLSVIFEVGKQTFEMLKGLARSVLKDLKAGFTELVGSGNESNVVFTVLGGAVKILSIGFTVLAKAVKLEVDWIVNLLKVAGAAATTLYNLGAAFIDPFNPAKWEAVGDSLSSTWERVKETAVEAFEDVKDMVTSTIAQFKTLDADVKVNAKSLEGAYSKAVNAVNASFDKLRAPKLEVATTALVDPNLWRTPHAFGEFTRVIVEGNKKAAKEVQLTWRETFDELLSDAKSAAVVYGLFADETGLAIDALVAHIRKVSDAILSTASDVTSSISELVQMRYSGELTEAENAYTKEKAWIEANVADEAERDAKIAALDAAYAKKTAAIKRKQFEAQRAADVVTATIATAEAVMTTFAKFGWPWGIIPAAIMGALGAAKVSMIASQPTPSFAAEGGDFTAGTTLMVGERGRELMTLGTSARVTSNEETEKILSRDDRPINLSVYAKVDSRVLFEVIERGIRRHDIKILEKDFAR